MKALPTSQGRRTDLELGDTAVPKLKAIEDAGFSKKQAQRFEQLASNPELVERAKAETQKCKSTTQGCKSTTQARKIFQCSCPFTKLKFFSTFSTLSTFNCTCPPLKIGGGTYNCPVKKKFTHRAEQN